MIRFSLLVRNVKNAAEYDKLLAAIEEFDLIKYVFDKGTYADKIKEAYFSTWEEQNWPSYNGQMLILSEKFPKMLFELTIQTESTFVRNYYKDGDTESCFGEVIFETPRKFRVNELVPF